MPPIRLCLFASTPDFLSLGFLVKVLTGDPQQLGRTAMAWGYDGIEFMPDPDRVPDPVVFGKALAATGAVMPVVNSGRIAAQKLALIHEDAAIRRRALQGLESRGPVARRDDLAGSSPKSQESAPGFPSPPCTANSVYHKCNWNPQSMRDRRIGASKGVRTASVQ